MIYLHRVFIHSDEILPSEREVNSVMKKVCLSVKNKCDGRIIKFPIFGDNFGKNSNIVIPVLYHTDKEYNSIYEILNQARKNNNEIHLIVYMRSSILFKTEISRRLILLQNKNLNHVYWM